MPQILALALLVAFCGAYLLRQFLTGSLDDAAEPRSPDLTAQDADEELRAA